MTAARWVSLIIGILLMPCKFEAKNPKAWDILGLLFTPEELSLLDTEEKAK